MIRPRLHLRTLMLAVLVIALAATLVVQQIEAGRRAARLREQIAIAERMLESAKLRRNEQEYAAQSAAWAASQAAAQRGGQRTDR